MAKRVDQSRGKYSAAEEERFRRDLAIALELSMREQRIRDLNDALKWALRGVVDVGVDRPDDVVANDTPLAMEVRADVEHEQVTDPKQKLAGSSVYGGASPKEKVPQRLSCGRSSTQHVKNETSSVDEKVSSDMDDNEIDNIPRCPVGQGAVKKVPRRQCPKKRPSKHNGKEVPELPAQRNHRDECELPAQRNHRDECELPAQRNHRDERELPAKCDGRKAPLWTQHIMNERCREDAKVSSDRVNNDVDNIPRCPVGQGAVKKVPRRQCPKKSPSERNHREVQELPAQSNCRKVEELCTNHYSLQKMASKPPMSPISEFPPLSLRQALFRPDPVARLQQPQQGKKDDCSNLSPSDTEEFLRALEMARERSLVENWALNSQSDTGLETAHNSCEDIVQDNDTDPATLMERWYTSALAEQCPGCEDGAGSSSMDEVGAETLTSKPLVTCSEVHNNNLEASQEISDWASKAKLGKQKHSTSTPSWNTIRSVWSPVADNDSMFGKPSDLPSVGMLLKTLPSVQYHPSDDESGTQLYNIDEETPDTMESECKSAHDRCSDIERKERS